MALTPILRVISIKVFTSIAVFGGMKRRRVSFATLVPSASQPAGISSGVVSGIRGRGMRLEITIIAEIHRSLVIDVFPLA